MKIYVFKKIIIIGIVFMLSGIFTSPIIASNQKETSIEKQGEGIDCSIIIFDEKPIIKKIKITKQELHEIKNSLSNIIEKIKLSKVPLGLW